MRNMEHRGSTVTYNYTQKNKYNTRQKLREPEIPVIKLGT